jgi:ribose transport system ATP-binding protein
MARLKAQGSSLVFISHFLEDVIAVSDRVTVLKNSRKVATLPNQGLTKAKLIDLMIGRDADALAESYAARGIELPPPASGKTVLSLRGLLAPGSFSDISFDLRAGEILGLFGNLGAGMTEIARALFGQVVPAAGEIALDGKPIRPRTTRESKRLGIAYLSENRRKTIFPRHEVYKNISLAHLDTLLGPDPAAGAGGGDRAGAGRADGGAAGQPAAERRQPLRRQPAEGGPCEVADEAAEGADPE